MSKTLLTRRPAPPKTRKVAFDAPEDLVARMDAARQRADEAGFDLPIEAALVDAYTKLVKRVEGELEKALTGGDDSDATTTAGESVDAADTLSKAPAQPVPNDFGTAA